MDLVTVSSSFFSPSIFSDHGLQVPLSETTDIALLESVIRNQTRILQTVYNTTDVSDIPQIWTLCQFLLLLMHSILSLHGLLSFLLNTDKEVEGYYEDGMRVPDYVTLLWTDDTYVDVLDLKVHYSLLSGM